VDTKTGPLKGVIMARKQTRQYTSEFKESALRLAADLGSRRLAAERLGISEANLSNWNMKKKKGERLI
jgi:transposase-like protein